MFQTFYNEKNDYISLTSSHLIYVIDKGYIKAEKVRLDDLLRVYSNQENKFNNFVVKRINFEFKKGFIAPLTNEGTILVNNVDTSCYAVINSHRLADFFMKPFKLWNQVWSIFEITQYHTDEESTIGINFYSKFLYSVTSRFLTMYLN